MNRFPRTTTIAAAGAVALLSAACTISINTDGKSVTRTFDVEDFDEIEIGNAFEATIEVGEATSVEVVIAEELEDKLEVEVDEGRLHVGVGGGLVATSGTMQITITTPELSALNVGGAVQADVEGLDATDFDLTVEGASDIEAGGSITNLTLTASGASQVDLDDITVDTAQVIVDGASNVSLSDVRTVTGSIAGASSLDIPDDGSIDVEVSGASTLD